MLTARGRVVVLAGAASAVVVVVAALASGAVPSAERVEELVTGTGAWGPVLYVATIVAIQPLGVPGIVWMAPAGLIWPAPYAVALSWVGNMGASVVGFVFARWIGREWAASRIPPRLVALDTRLGHRGLAPVVGLRLLTGGLAPADWLLGLSSVRWRTFLLGTAVGMVPGICMAVLVGGGFLGWALDQPPWILGAVAVAGAAAVAGLVRFRHRLDAAARGLRRRALTRAR